jgi:hypothetical protein
MNMGAGDEGKIQVLFPLPPDLDSVAGPVQGAIKKLDKVPLASFQLDKFRAHFKSEFEATSILPPMDDALRRKRKAVKKQNQKMKRARLLQETENQ